METSTEKVLNEALHLSPAQRAAVAEGLLSSLDTPDSKLDEIWAREVEDRIDAAERGEMPMVSENEVFAKYKNR